MHEKDSSGFDIIVIGSGLSGIAFSRFYLDTHPTCSLLVIDEDSGPGGVWSSSRSYKGFWTQSPLRLAGFSDVQLTIPPDAPRYHDTFEAKYVTKYIEDYVDSHVYNGTPLRDRLMLSTSVKMMEKSPSLGWIVHTQQGSGATKRVHSAKVVVASGSSSIPNKPDLPQSETFNGQILHQKDYAHKSSSILDDHLIQNVTVLGGGKSSADMAYQSVKHGKKVDWIIRKSGEGPALFTIAAGRGKFKSSVEMGATRYNASFAPSAFAPWIWWSPFLHRSSYGQDHLRQRTRDRDHRCKEVAKYQSREGALACFKDLEPSTSAFWCTGPLALTQHEDFWDTIAQSVNIHRNDIETMSGKGIKLENGPEIPTDVLLCGTGWRLQYPFLSADQVRSLGLPRASDECHVEDRKWEQLLMEADHQVLKKYPLLKDPPPFRKPQSSTTARLYKCIAPLQDDSVVFLGHARLADMFRTAEAQAIWATAYFDGHVKLPRLDRAEREVSYMNALSMRRYPSQGATGDFFFFDSIFYSDDLLRQVGLKSHQRRWLAYWREPCVASDFRGIKDEYIRKYGIKA